MRCANPKALQATRRSELRFRERWLAVVAVALLTLPQVACSGCGLEIADAPHDAATEDAAPEAEAAIDASARFEDSAAEAQVPPRLRDLVVNAGTLAPAFDQATTHYGLEPGAYLRELILTATADEDVVITIDGAAATDFLDLGDGHYVRVAAGCKPSDLAA